MFGTLAGKNLISKNYIIRNKNGNKPIDFKEDILRNIKLVVHYYLTILMYYVLNL